MSAPTKEVAHREAKLKQVVFVSMFELALRAIFHVAGSTRVYELNKKTGNRAWTHLDLVTIVNNTVLDDSL